MSVRIHVIFVIRHFADKIIFETIDIYIRKRSHSNAANVEKDFANLELWPFTGYYTWKKRQFAVLFVRDVLIKGQI